MNSLLFGTATAVLLCLSTADVIAQTNQAGGAQRRGGGRQRQGNFDPAQFQQRMMDRYRERLEITDDAEWKALQPLIQAVMDARISLASAGRGNFGRGTRGGRTGGDGNSATAARRDSARSNPGAEELQKAIDTKAPAPEMKTVLAKYLDYRKSKQADLEKAQAALRAVLTSRQEAIAVLAGLL